MHALTKAGCIRIFADKKSGKNAEREELAMALDYLRAGDTLAVPSKYLPELKQGRAALTAVPEQRAISAAEASATAD